MISTIITTKNGAKYIGRAIDSALAQIPALQKLSPSCDMEIIVVSDGSTDNTTEIVREKILHSPKIKLIDLKQNIGPGRARNLAILGGDIEGTHSSTITHHDGAQGEYIAILDDDDIWTDPKKLANQKVFLDIDDNVVVVGASKVEFVTEDSKHIRFFCGEKDPSKVRKNMLVSNPVITSSVLFRTSIFKGLGGFENMYLAEDYDLWLRMGLVGQIVNIDGADTQYTVRKNSASNTRRLELNKVVLSLIKIYKDRYPNYITALLKAYARIILFHFKKFF